MSEGFDGAGNPEDAAELSRRLAELAGELQGARGDSAIAVAAVEAQRLAARALRSAVAGARRSGMSWRELSALLGVPYATLFRQHQANGGPGPGASERRIARPAAPPERPARGSCPAPPPDLFTGRDRELADLPSLLSRRRLVTLCGPPGVGKTRLAVEFCHRMSSSRWSSVIWVPVAAVTEPARLPAAIISAATGRTSGALDAVIATACESGKTLLVLDSCEHIADGCADTVRALLDRHPRLTVLATSREPLQLAGEAPVRVAPLPAVPTDPADEWLSASPAARLFADRAAEITHDLNLTGHHSAVAAICNAVDGLPLAIELAAQLCATMPLESIPPELTDHLDILAGIPHSRLNTHHGLRAAIEHSYALLDEDEQRLFRRLAIVPGGSDHATAAALTGDYGASSAELHDLLGRLVRKSLLTTDPAAPGWFTMLRPLQAFGRDRLDAAHETDPVHALLFTWLAARADNLWTENFRSSAPDLWNWTAGELANFRYAASVVGRGDEGHYPLLAAISAQFLIQRAELDQAELLVQRILAIPGLSTADEARALAVSAQVLVLRGRWTEAQQQLTRAHQLAGSAGNEALALQILSSLICTYSEDESGAAEAAARARELISELRRCGDTELLATASANAAWYFLASGCEDEARAAIAETVALRSGRLKDDERQTAGVVALTFHRIANATAYFAEGLRHSANVYTALDHIEGIALAAAQQGDDYRALCLLTGADAARTELGLANGSWWAGKLGAATASVRTRLRAADVRAAAATGAGLTLAQLTEYALNNRVVTPAEPDRPLNPRENQVAALIAEGHNNKQIAARLSLSVRTVEAHTTKIRTKLGLSSRAQIAHWVATYAPAQDRSRA